MENKLSSYPDRETANYVINGFRYGFKLGLTKYPQPRGPCKNSKTVRDNPGIAQQLVDKEVAKGHILGPFAEPPLEKLVYSPISIVPKAGSENAWRLVHDLSFPHGTDHEQESVNACIPPENSSVKYHYLEEVIQMALSIGISCVAAKIDIQHAFRNLGN